MRDLSVLRYLGVPFRRCRSGQESAPMLLLFLRHNASKLSMQVRRLFLILAPERDEGTIEIHRRKGEQSKEDLLVNQGKNVRQPHLRAQVGLGQNEIKVS